MNFMTSKPMDNGKIKLTKKLKTKPRKWDINKGFENFWYIPENLESLVYAQGSVHDQERSGD